VTLALWLFGGSFALCAYVYFGYPALIFVLSRLSPRPVRRGPGQPSVSLIIPAYNEGAAIEEKIRNSLALDYPRDRLEVLIVSDGSTDDTEAVVARHAAEGVRLLALPRGGKAAALNAGARAARGEILVLTDANATLEPAAVARLVACFADPEVGGVCGNKKYGSARGADATAGGENLYWRYDKWQKGLESAHGSIFAADGALHALREELYVPIADPAQADDIALSTRVVLQGRRLVFEPLAVAWEDAPVEGKGEFERKVRVTNHSVRALLNLGWALVGSGFYSVELLSHKLLRHLVPFFLVVLLLSNAFVAVSHPFFRVVLLGQAVFYASALAGFALRRTWVGRRKLLSVPYYFCLVNAAAFVGVLSILGGRRIRAWTPRSGLPAPKENE
jgi:cellulose synthase/poly-beta-1,6-N-acetylglucosamine synthase-like glycosyltransferase